MREVFICDYVRTPIGRFGGALASMRVDDLGAIARYFACAHHRRGCARIESQWRQASARNDMYWRGSGIATAVQRT
jgi:acetyl-CoA acetyltransferase